jgi:hypothetical protein
MSPCPGCGRPRLKEAGPGREPVSAECSACAQGKWVTERKLTAGEVKRRAQAYLARTYPDRAEARAALLDRVAKRPVLPE